MDTLISKSELKRRARRIEDLVVELAALPPGQIASLPCDREVRDEILAGRNLKGGARKRQLKYITKLLRAEPVEELYDFLARHQGSRLKAKREFQELEHYRNLLISEVIQLLEEQMPGDGFANEDESVIFPQDSGVLRTIVRRLPGIDRDLVQNTALQFARTRNPKFSRELFRILKAAAEKAQFSKQRDRDNGI